MAEENEFRKLNKALGEYYKSLKDDTFYKEPHTKGKFLAYCVCLRACHILEPHSEHTHTLQEENGLEAEDMEEEFAQNDASESMYVDFDEHFPFAPDTDMNLEDTEARQQAIFNVIKSCYANGKAPAGLDAVNLDLNVDSEQMARAEAVYTSQCPAIFQQQEETLKEVFAIGLKNDCKYHKLI